MNLSPFALIISDVLNQLTRTMKLPKDQRRDNHTNDGSTHKRISSKGEYVIAGLYAPLGTGVTRTRSFIYCLANNHLAKAGM